LENAALSKDLSKENLAEAEDKTGVKEIINFS
jgi:hypothetical protein